MMNFVKNSCERLKIGKFLYECFCGCVWVSVCLYGNVERPVHISMQPSCRIAYARMETVDFKFRIGLIESIFIGRIVTSCLAGWWWSSRRNVKS